MMPSGVANTPVRALLAGGLARAMATQNRGSIGQGTPTCPSALIPTLAIAFCVGVH
jgi:hypothetical protein